MAERFLEERGRATQLQLWNVPPEGDLGWKSVWRKGTQRRGLPVRSCAPRGDKEIPPRETETGWRGFWEGWASGTSTAAALKQEQENQERVNSYMVQKANGGKDASEKQARKR